MLRWGAQFQTIFPTTLLTTPLSSLYPVRIKVREGGPPRRGCHRGHGPWNDGLLRHLRRRTRARRRHDALRQLLYRLLNLMAEKVPFNASITIKSESDQIPGVRVI